MEEKIDHLRRKLLDQVQEADNDLLNSTVLNLSQKLDQFIIEEMKEKTN